MTSLQQLEKEARERQAQFNATLSDVQGRITPAGLAKEVLLRTDPHLSRLSPAFLAVKRHPVVTAAAIAGMSWLLKQVLRQPARRIFKNGHITSSDYPHIPPVNSKTLRKETIHEND
jgi:hypothetical protein